MTKKKSAASVKLVKKPSVDVQGIFEDQKAYEQTIIEQQIVCANRVDFTIDLRKDWIDFFGEKPNVNQLKMYQQLAIELYKEVKAIIDGYTFEYFASEDFSDPVGGYVDSIDSFNSDEELWWSGMKYFMVRPFGEHAINLHRQIIEAYDAGVTTEQVNTEEASEDVPTE